MATTGVTGGDLATSRPRAGRAVRRLTTETKQAFKTSEFWAMVGLVAAILVSAAVIKGGDDGTDQFIARHAGSMSRFWARATSSHAGSPSREAASLTSTTPAIPATVTTAATGTDSVSDVAEGGGSAVGVGPRPGRL
jgi:hypothetical protein